MEEIYKDIPGFEGRYQISNFGNVRSVERLTIYKDGRKQHFKEKLLVCTPDLKGYPKIRLENYTTGKGATKRVHSLVWETFGVKRK